MHIHYLPVSFLPTEDLGIFITPAIGTNRTNSAIYTYLNTSIVRSWATHYIQLDLYKVTFREKQWLTAYRYPERIDRWLYMLIS